MRRNLRLSPLAVIAAAVALAASGCGGGTEDRTEGMSPDEILAAARREAGTATRFAIDATASVGARVTGDGDAAAIVQALRGGIAIEASGTADGANATIDWSASLGGLPPFQGNLTKVGAQLFVGLLGTDYRVDVSPATVRAVNPARLPAGALGWITEPEVVGRETVGDRDTVHLRGALDVPVAAADVARAARALGAGEVGAATLARATAELRTALRVRTVDVWVGTADLLPRRMSAEVRLDRPLDAVPRVRSGSLTLDLTFVYEVDAVTITAPATNEVLDPGRLRTLG